MLKYIDNKHAFVKYEIELKETIDSLSSMREKVILQLALIKESIDSGKEKSPNSKKEVKLIQNDISDIQWDLEQRVYNIVASYAPQMEELRFVLSIIKLASQFGRMSKHCKNVSKQFSSTEPDMKNDIKKISHY